LRFTDTTPEVLLLRPDDPLLRVFPSGTIDAVPVAGYVVVGDPPGVMNNTIDISLLSGATVVDAARFGGDTVGNTDDLNATDLDDEAGARLPDGADTDISADDFAQQRATPGVSNELDECSLDLDNCDPLGACVDTAAGFDCTCPEGYILDGDGVTCIDVDECTDMTDDCDSNATCENTAGSFMCSCNAGYSGDGTTCIDIDECADMTDNCDSNAICTNAAPGFTCACNDGFSGDGLTCVVDRPGPGNDNSGNGNGDGSSNANGTDGDDNDSGCAATSPTLGWLAIALVLRRRRGGRQGRCQMTKT
ncbi:MAG: EGF domain-containing protein, partial [Myxococcota bacterium]